MQALLDFLNGKKTAIGAAILSIFTIATLFGVKVPSVSQDQVTHYIDLTVQVVGVIAAVWGVTHKIVKASNPPAPPKA